MNWRDLFLAISLGVSAGVIALLCGRVIYLIATHKKEEKPNNP